MRFHHRVMIDGRRVVKLNSLHLLPVEPALKALDLIVLRIIGIILQVYVP